MACPAVVAMDVIVVVSTVAVPTPVLAVPRPWRHVSGPVPSRRWHADDVSRTHGLRGSRRERVRLTQGHSGSGSVRRPALGRLPVTGATAVLLWTCANVAVAVCVEQDGTGGGAAAGGSWAVSAGSGNGVTAWIEALGAGALNGQGGQIS